MDIVAVIMAAGGLGIVVGIIITWIMFITSSGRTPIEEGPKCHKFDCIYRPENEGAGYLRWADKWEVK